MSALSFLPVIGTLADLASELIEDPDQRNRFQAELAKADAAIRAAQLELNRTEAQHASLFVAGWRPAIGWLGVAGLGYAYLVQPMLAWASGVAGWLAPPTVDLAGLYPLILGMLGLGAARSFEKARHVARETMRSTP